MHCTEFPPEPHTTHQGVVTQRRFSPHDLPFLERLYASTRTHELAATGWPPEAIGQFLRQQFQAQHTSYQAHHDGAEFWVLCMNDAPMGRLYWNPHTDPLGLIDISLLPEYRQQGIGTVLLGRQLRWADSRRLAVQLFVEPNNPAQRLYQRLGFEVVDDNQIYLRMRRAPRPPPASEQAQHTGLRVEVNP